MSKFNYHIPWDHQTERLYLIKILVLLKRRLKSYKILEYLGDVFVNNLELNSYENINVYDLKIDKTVK